MNRRAENYTRAVHASKTDFPRKKMYIGMKNLRESQGLRPVIPEVSFPHARLLLKTRSAISHLAVEQLSSDHLFTFRQSFVKNDDRDPF